MSFVGFHSEQDADGKWRVWGRVHADNGELVTHTAIGVDEDAAMEEFFRVEREARHKWQADCERMKPSEAAYDNAVDRLNAGISAGLI